MTVSSSFRNKRHNKDDCVCNQEYDIEGEYFLDNYGVIGDFISPQHKVKQKELHQNRH